MFSKYLLKFFSFAVLCVVAFVLYVLLIISPSPNDAIENQFFDIKKGSSLGTIADLLEEKNIISSSTFFKIGVYLLDKENDVKSGMYFLAEPQSMEQVIRKVVSGSFTIPTERVTILEGYAAYRFADTVAEKLPFVDADELLELIEKEKKEGYLYPDTYFFPQDADPARVISIMEKNFNKKIEPYRKQIMDSRYTLDEILTMASLVENEAGSASYETKRRVAGVLWKRVDVGIPIQADAVFSYIFQRHLPRVLLRHLEVDSPYNLYKVKGLPPGPIGNPSIDSIKATLDPVITEDLFYLTGFDGKFYYARTNGGHERNRRLHLNYRN